MNLTKQHYAIGAFLLLALLAGAWSGYQGRSNPDDFSLQDGNDPAIQTLIQAYEQAPDNFLAHLALAGAYLQKVRETADTSFYNDIERLMDHAETIKPEDPEILYVRASVAAGRHQFRQAQALIEQALAKQPNTPRYLGILADTQIELGLYEESVTTLQTMIDQRPDFASYSRIAYARELRGDLAGAIEAMQSTIRSGSTFKENIAWAYNELGKLYFVTDLDEAKKQFEIALETYPNYTPALQGLARIAYLQNDVEQAKSLLEQAYKLLPLASYSADLGDIYFLEGNNEQSTFYYNATKAAYTISQNQGTNVDQEFAAFLNERNLDLRDSYVLSHQAYQQRPNVVSAMVVAWSLRQARVGTDAQAKLEEALKLGAKNGQVYYYLSDLYKAMGDTTKQAEFLKKARENRPYASIIILDNIFNS